MLPFVYFNGYRCARAWGRYANGRLALKLEQQEGRLRDTFLGPTVAIATTNCGTLELDCIAVRAWGAGEGMVEALVDAGVIEGEPVKHVGVGALKVGVYKLTVEALEEALGERGLGDRTTQSRLPMTRG